MRVPFFDRRRERRVLRDVDQIKRGDRGCSRRGEELPLVDHCQLSSMDGPQPHHVHAYPDWWAPRGGNCPQRRGCVALLPPWRSRRGALAAPASTQRRDCGDADRWGDWLAGRVQAASQRDPACLNHQGAVLFTTGRACSRRRPAERAESSCALTVVSLAGGGGGSVRARPAEVK